MRNTHIFILGGDEKKCTKDRGAALIREDHRSSGLNTHPKGHMSITLYHSKHSNMP